MISNDIVSRSFDPDRPDFAPYGLTCVHWRPSSMGRADHHNEIELNFLMRGSITYLLAGRKTVVRAGQLSAFWAAFPHRLIDFTADAAYFVATIPLPWFLQWQQPAWFRQALLQGDLIHEPGVEHVAADGLQFAQWEVDLLHDRTRLERVVLCEMQARLLRLALHVVERAGPGDPPDRPPARDDGGLTPAERMACFIARNYTEPLTVQKVAAAVNLHPNYAMALFQRTFGTTLMRCLTQQRVAHAQVLLTTTNLTIVDVAESSGFMSVSRFRDAFRRVSGGSPREYCRSHLRIA